MYLQLTRIPERIVGLRILELLVGVEVSACILGVLGERLTSPCGKAGERVVVGVVVAEVVGQLAAHDHLLEKGRCHAQVSVRN